MNLFFKTIDIIFCALGVYVVFKGYGLGGLLVLLFAFALYRQITKRDAEKHFALYNWPLSERCYCSYTGLFGVHQQSLNHKLALSEFRENGAFTTLVSRNG